MTEAYVVWATDWNENQIVEDYVPLYICMSLQAAREAMKSLMKEAAHYEGCKIEMVSEEEVNILDTSPRPEWRITYHISKTPIY